MLYGRFYNSTPTSTVDGPSPTVAGSTSFTNKANVRDEGVVDGSATTFATGTVDGISEDFQSVQIHSPTTGPQGWWTGVVVDLDVVSVGGSGVFRVVFDHADVNLGVNVTSSPGRAQYIVNWKQLNPTLKGGVPTSVDFPVSLIASWGGGGNIVVRVYEVQYIYLPRGEVVVQEG